MTDERKQTPPHSAEETITQQRGGTPGHIDRRSLFRGAAALTVGALSAPAAFAQLAVPSSTPGPGPAPAPAPVSADKAAELAAQTRRALRWAGADPADWVRPRAGADHNVVIIGGGQSGVAIGYALKRKGVGKVDIVDRADPGQAGIWRNIARMHQLRTPKTLAASPDGGNAALSFRAWYETLNGPEAFDALDRIPRLAWADYLTWFQEVTDTKVRYRTQLLDIEPAGDLLRLHLTTDGTPRVETTRKLVLATGYAGAGGPNVPDFIRALPADVWTHTTGRIPTETLRGKIVGVVGAGSSAFDAAATALEAGAAEVHLFSRRAFIDYQAPAPRPGTPPPAAPAPAPVDRGHSGLLEFAYTLPESVRWRNFVWGDRRVSSVPLDSLERAVAFKNFHIHLNTSLSDVAMSGNRVSAKAGRKTLRFDHVIAATGYRIDLAAQPELARIHENIALWRDRYQPGPGEESTAGSYHPYLGEGFEFLPRGTAGAEYLRNIHCFNLGAALSFGIPVGDVPSMVDHPRLLAAIVRDLGHADVEQNQRFFNTQQVAPNPAPYERAVEGKMPSAA